QAPGIALTAAEKLEVAEQLARLGVDVIEAGFPASSPGEFEAVRRIAGTVKGTVVAALCRANDGDIDRAWEAIRDAQAARLHVFISTSSVHLTSMLRMSERDVVVATRGQATGLSHGLRLREVARTSRLVSMLTGYPVQPNKAVVGANAFAHESGIHQHGVLSNRATYEIMDPTEIGFEGSKIVLGKHSGRHAFADALAKL